MSILRTLRSYAELDAPIIQRILKHGDHIGYGCLAFCIAFAVWSAFVQWG